MGNVNDDNFHFWVNYISVLMHYFYYTSPSVAQKEKNFSKQTNQFSFLKPFKLFSQHYAPTVEQTLD